MKITVLKYGRGGGIWTPDHLNPIQERHFNNKSNSSIFFKYLLLYFQVVSCFFLFCQSLETFLLTILLTGRN